MFEEVGTCFRNELSELLGLAGVRQAMQNLIPVSHAKKFRKCQHGTFDDFVRPDTGTIC